MLSDLFLLHLLGTLGSRRVVVDSLKALDPNRPIREATNIAVYFCDPQNPWQRGPNENTNRLLRRYFLKRNDLSVYSQTHPNKVASAKRTTTENFDIRNPAENFNACIASTG